MPSHVSLAMTVYNRENYLSLALDSILIQTYPHWHLTIWDDGSTDSSPAIAREYAKIDPRIRFIPAPHTGRQHALRAAIRATNLPYLAFIDSDDLLAPDALAATVDLLDTQSHIGMVYTDHAVIDTQGKVLGLGSRCQIPYSPERLLIDFMTFHFRLIRREIYDKVGGIDTSFDSAEDYDLCLKISEITQIQHLPQPLYYYRDHPQSISKTSHTKQIEASGIAVRNALARRGLADRYQLNISPTGRFAIQHQTNRSSDSNVTLLSCIGTDVNISNPNLLHHFLAHYRRLGITNWAITLHVGLNPELNNLQTFAEILKQYDIPYEVWQGEFNVFERERNHNIFMHTRQAGEWILGVDLDEFVDFPRAIPEYLERLSQQGYNCLGGELIDRVDSLGILKTIQKDIPIQAQFPRTARVKQNIYKPSLPKIPFEKKLAIQKPLQWGIGHHYLEPHTKQYQKESPFILAIEHYAWDALLRSRIQQRLEHYRKYPGFNWGQEHLNMLEYIKEFGRFKIEDIV